jgi:1-acyl-sn-glycerol-3-phosphate acyltransferase
MSGLTALWRGCFYEFLTRVYFARITLLNPERRPRTGPVLYLGLHRNGAVDGFVYHRALGGPTFMISTQLRRNWFARLFFTGIAVTRTKDDGDRGDNEAALRECVELLRKGGTLFVFPEGTSSLGPRHLPFKSGAIWLIRKYLESPGPPLQVIPAGIHYECPWAFRAKVEVVLGESIDLTQGASSPRPSPPREEKTSRSPASIISSDQVALVTTCPKMHRNQRVLAEGSGELAALKALKRQMQVALERVGINVPSEEYHDQVQKLAYTSTLATPRSYFASLKAFEREIPRPLLEEGQRLDALLKGRRLLEHQGVPLVPMSLAHPGSATGARAAPDRSRQEATGDTGRLARPDLGPGCCEPGPSALHFSPDPQPAQGASGSTSLGPVMLYALALLVLSPVVLAAILFNAPAVMAGFYAGKKFPDDLNVISLWKILVGIPLFLLWVVVVSTTLLLVGKVGWLGLYALVTWVGLQMYYRVKKLAVAVHNGLRYPELRGELLRFRELVLQHLPADPFVRREQ